MNKPCAFCGGPADRLHHPTGRDHEGRYLDPMLVFPADHDCHEFVHDDWRQENVDKLDVALTPVEYIAIGLHRLAMNLGRVDDAIRGGTFWALLGSAAERWATVIDDHVRYLDERSPAWRDEQGLATP